MSRELRTKLHNAIGDCCFGREGTLVSWLRSPSDVEQYIYDKLAAAEDAPPAATECQCHEEESGFGPWVDRSQCPIHAQPPQAPKEQTGTCRWSPEPHPYEKTCVDWKAAAKPKEPGR